MVKDGIYLLKILRHWDIGKNKMVFKIKAKILRPLDFCNKELFLYVTNTKKHRNAQIIKGILQKKEQPIILANLKTHDKKIWINKPIFEFSENDWDNLENLANTIEKYLSEWAKQYEADLKISPIYNSYEFRAWFLRWTLQPEPTHKIIKVIRVGCPFFVKYRAFWISAKEIHVWIKPHNDVQVHEIDLTEKTKIKVNAWLKYAPKYRVYHNNSNVIKKLLEVVEYYYKKLFKKESSIKA